MLICRCPPWLPIAVGLGVFLLPGCGKRYATVSGTVVLPGDLKTTGKDLVQITFVPDAKGEKVGSAVFNSEDNTFVCKDVAPGGKYKIAGMIEATAAVGDNAKRAAQVAAFNKTFDPAITKLTYQATDDSAQAIAIDFAKSTVTATKK